MTDNYEMLGSIHEIITQQIKGKPDEIAHKLNISRSCLYSYIGKLILFGAEIKYCRTKNCFVYQNNFKFKFILETNEMCKVVGGQKKIFNFFPSVHNIWTEEN